MWSCLSDPIIKPEEGSRRIAGALRQTQMMFPLFYRRSITVEAARYEYARIAEMYAASLRQLIRDPDLKGVENAFYDISFRPVEHKKYLITAIMAVRFPGISPSSYIN